VSEAQPAVVVQVCLFMMSGTVHGSVKLHEPDRLRLNFTITTQTTSQSCMQVLTHSLLVYTSIQQGATATQHHVQTITLLTF
jgi:hypothetical protein